MNVGMNMEEDLIQPEETLTLERFCAAICDGIQGGLPGVRSAAFWPVIGRRINLPAVIIEMPGFKPGTDQGTGETALIAHIQARLVVDPVPGRAELQAATLSAGLAHLLRGQQWGLPIAPAELISASQDWTSPELDGYCVWLVEWTHELYIGEMEWPWEDEPPGSLVFNLGAEDVLPEELE